MLCQHREFHLRLEDAKQLRRYAGSAVPKDNSLNDALDKVRAKSRYWERKAKKGTNRATSEENEKDEANEESQIARLDVVIASNAGAQVEDEIDKVRDALAVAEGAKRKAEAETSRLEVEQTSLLLEIGAEKD